MNGALARPASRRELFWAFTWLALQGFGGVLAVGIIPLVNFLEISCNFSIVKM